MKDSKYFLHFKVKISLGKTNFKLPISYPHTVNVAHLQHIKVNLNNMKENQNQSKNVILRER